MVHQQHPSYYGYVGHSTMNGAAPRGDMARLPQGMPHAEAMIHPMKQPQMQLPQHVQPQHLHQQLQHPQQQTQHIQHQQYRPLQVQQGAQQVQYALHHIQNQPQHQQQQHHQMQQHQPLEQQPQVAEEQMQAEDVAAAFAYQYFKVMKARPDNLFRFYEENSHVTRGCCVEGADVSSGCGPRDLHHASGHREIAELFHREFSALPPLSLASLATIQAQDSAGGAVLLQITGCLQYADRTSREFMMSAFLAPQEVSKALPSGYYVHNDIILYKDRVAMPVESYPVGIPAAMPYSSVGQQAANGITVQQGGSCFNAHLGEGIRVEREVAPHMESVTLPIAHPETYEDPATAPLVAGSTNEYNTVAPPQGIAHGRLGETRNEDCNMSQSVKIAAPKNEEPRLRHLAGNPSDKDQAIGKQSSECSTAVPQYQPADSGVSQQSQPALRRRTDQDVAGEDAPSQVEITQGSLDSVEPEEKAVAAPSDGRGPPQATKTSSDKRSPWKSIDAPRNAAAGVAETASPQKRPTAAGQGVSPSYSPVDPSVYNSNSYAGRLLKQEGGALKAPCQMGFAVPAPRTKRTEPHHEQPRHYNEQGRQGHDQNRQSQEQGRPENSRGPMRGPKSGGRPGRGRTLWVSTISSDLSDDAFRAAIGEQLKNLSLSGNVVRIERSLPAAHGYIEFDSEAPIRPLLETGLNIEGRVIPVDVPRSGAAGGSAGGDRTRRSDQGEEGSRVLRPQGQRQGGRNGQFAKQGQDLLQGVEGGKVEDGWVVADKKSVKKVATSGRSGGVSHRFQPGQGAQRAA